MKLLYIHGYNGDPYGQSYQNLKNVCGNKHELYTIDYNPDFPMQAIKDIFKFVKENKIDVVIGASLGGFLTMKLYGVSRIVINPCWNPAVELPKIGYEGNVLAYEELLDEMTETLDFEERHLCTGIFSNEDELLEQKYVSVFKKYFKRAYDIFGGHKINPGMANMIVDCVLPLHIAATSDFSYKLKEIDNAPWLD